MSILRLLILLIAGALSFLTLQAAPQPSPTNPIHAAEESFIAELNSMAGIERHEGFGSEGLWINSKDEGSSSLQFEHVF